VNHISYIIGDSKVATAPILHPKIRYIQNASAPNRSTNVTGLTLVNSCSYICPLVEILFGLTWSFIDPSRCVPHVANGEDMWWFRVRQHVYRMNLLNFVHCLPAANLQFPEPTLQASSSAVHGRNNPIRRHSMIVHVFALRHLVLWL
jgi:hypothetical protein